MKKYLFLSSPLYAHNFKVVHNGDDMKVKKKKNEKY